jgi:lipopolysaccharide export system protein LptA
MNSCNEDKFISLTRYCVTAALFFACSTSWALPDDQNQQIDVVAASSEINLNDGLYVYRGTDAEPAQITQGSMQITGTEIRIERSGRVLKRVTASGTPARFQQQPDVDQAVIHASGHTLDYDNDKRMLNVDGEAEFNQDGSVISAHHIDYNLDTRNANATSSGKGVRMSLPPLAPDTP